MIVWSIAYWYCDSLGSPDCKDEKRAQVYRRDAEVALSPILLYGKDRPDEGKEANSAKEPAKKCTVACALVIRTLDDPVALFAGLLFVVVLVQLNWATGQQRVLADSVKAANRAASAAQDSADYLKRSERARIFVEVHYGGLDHTTQYGHVPANVTIKALNHGKTAASITKIDAILMASKTVPDRAEPSDAAFPDGFAIAPGGEFLFSPHTKLETFRAGDEWNYDVLWYCFGEVTYKDNFEETHTTGFCWFVRQKDAERFTFCVDSPVNRQT